METKGIDFGRAVRRARMDEDMDVKQLAHLLRRSRITIWRLERGIFTEQTRCAVVRRWPHLEVLKHIETH